MLKKLSLILFTAFTFLFIQGFPVYAQIDDSIPQEIRGGCNGTEVNTALGCITTTPDSFVNTILGFAVGISGATALLLLLYGFFLLSTSSGNPDKVKLGKEVITSAIAGLVFVAMSVTLMGFIGINILGIPGLQ